MSVAVIADLARQLDEQGASSYITIWQNKDFLSFIYQQNGEPTTDWAAFFSMELAGFQATEPVIELNHLGEPGYFHQDETKGILKSLAEQGIILEESK